MEVKWLTKLDQMSKVGSRDRHAWWWNKIMLWKITLWKIMLSKGLLYYIFGEIKMFASRVQINMFRKKLPLKLKKIFWPTKYIVYILLHYVLIFRAFSARWSTPIGPEASWKTFWSGRKKSDSTLSFCTPTSIIWHYTHSISSFLVMHKTIENLSLKFSY